MVDDLKYLGPSLARRLTLALTAVVAGVTLLAGGWFYLDAVDRAKAGVEEKARQTAVYLQGALSLPLWGIDDAAVGMIGQTLMEDRAFTAVTIRDSEGAIIFSKQLEEGPEALTRHVTIEHRGEEIGTVELSLSSRAMSAHTENLLRASGTTLLAVLLAITLGTVFLIRLFLKRPIEQLIGVARSFGTVEQAGAMPKSYREFQPLLSVLGGMESRINRQIAQLAESEEKFRAIFDGVNDAIFLHDGETGEILDVNRAMCGMFGYAAAEVGALTVGDLSSGKPPYSQDDALAWIFSARKGETPLFEWHCRRRNGELFWGEVAMRQALIDGSERILVATRDITERKEAEAALKKSEERFRTLVEGAETMILVISPQGCILEINPHAEKVLACAREEALGMDAVEAFLLEEDRQAVRANIAKVLGGEVTIGYETPVISFDGGERVFLWNVSRLLDEAGEPYGVLSIGHDITEKKELERMKSEFIATAAHELRTPLTSVRGFAEVLVTREDLDEESRGRYLAIIHEKAMVLERIIDDLLNLSRVESGRLIRLERESSDLKALLLCSVDSYSREFSDHRFESNLPEKAMTLFADPTKIGQVFENLLSNAVKFSPEDCPIEVRGELGESEALFSVRDSGIGMTPEQAKRIFDKFFRVDASNTGKQGLGLGMSIARAIVEGHGGRIWVESEPGIGTAISFTIPLGEQGELPL